MADITTLIVISSFIMFPAVMMAQEVVNHGVCPVPMNKEEEEIIKEQERNREEMEEIMREIEISCLDECKTGLHNCHDDAYCTNTKRSFTCTCKEGYIGDGVNCADINECETGEHLCDTDISECKNAKGFYMCVCKSGYEHKCIDKCKRGLHNCHDDAYCTSTTRSFTCTCKPGYTGDGVNCADINECDTGNHLCDTDISECKNNKGSYKCACKSGYEDICADRCNRGRHNCHDDADCTNTKSLFTCTCKPGYIGDGVNCADINECETGNHQCDADISVCNNTKGSYKCVCRSGFSKSGHEHKCTDINECDTGKHNCNATSSLCQNTKGSFRCVCREGYNESVPEHNCTEPSTCKDIYDTTLKRENKAYLLNVESKQIPVYCQMEAAELGACGGGGWTLVMKIDGKQNTFHYDSNLWTNKTDHNSSAGKTLLDHQETKLPTYWSTPFTKICLAMKIGHQVNSIVINKHANSLHSLIADGKYRSTSLGRDTWKKLIGQQASLQKNCNKEGFNALSKGYQSKVRIGIISNEQNDCISPDSRIGFGTGGYPHDRLNTCGNAAQYQPDNGRKNIKAMGYILVQ